VDFGFCACSSKRDEALLAYIYRELISRCSFDELLTAFKSSDLLSLIDRKGLMAERQEILHLEDILRGSPFMNKSVWDLKQFVLAENVELIPPVGADYGFFNCAGEAERLELKKVYQRVFNHSDGDPIRLHEAAIAGKLFEYISSLTSLKKKKKKFRRLLTNPYPLPDFEDSPSDFEDPPLDIRSSIFASSYALAAYILLGAVSFFVFIN